ncbi:MAG: hypothetical protein HC890_01970, partial [Chloroflexaceae bacterium]|nr:hypothetical protein [Chloroflexaceae bacterium]
MSRNVWLLSEMGDRDPELEEQVARLHELLVYRRWWIALGCWLTLGAYGLWGLRQEFSLWRDYFTWT